MSDEIKIVPDPAPAEPFDVAVNPDPPPAKPFDVPTNPSPGPAGTFDVATYPDQPPVGPYDVPTYPDPPALGPVDVPTSPDGPPIQPHDVPLSPDPAPISPFDVPLAPDSPPGEPVDVPTSPDGAPLEPYDVPTTPDSTPADPFDVPIAPDGPPITPVNVGVTYDNPPAAPFDVPIEPSPPPALIVGGVRGETTIGSIIGAIKNLDAPLASFLGSLIDIDTVSVSVAGGGALDPFILAGWFRDYINTVGPGKLGRFIAEQQMLFAMNPVAARVFDPTYFIKMSIPGSMGNFHATLDTQLGANAATVALIRDEVLQFKVSINPEKPGGDGLSERPDVYGPENTMMDGQDFSVDEMVDAAIDKHPHHFLSDDVDTSGLTPVKTFDSSKYFHERDSNGVMSVRAIAKQRAAQGIENLNSRQAALVSSNFLNGVVRVPISPNESADGAVYSQTQNPSDLVDDDDTRVPLCFTDLRKDPIRNAYRSVYFRPMGLNFSRSTSPEWAESSAFGRVDPIVSYQRTTRSYSVSFEAHAFAPEDLEVMYNKLTWLDSMCYPTYGSDSLMRSGPVTRMRIGDAVSTENGGLSGIIKGLNVDFAEMLWELKQGFKVPRGFKVSLDFLALHEGPVGLMNGVFGVFRLPSGPKEQGQFTNFADNGTANAGQSRDAAPKGAEIIPGGYSKFGEPKKRG